MSFNNCPVPPEYHPSPDPLFLQFLGGVGWRVLRDCLLPSTGPEDPSRAPEQRLNAEFADLVAGVDLQSLFVPIEGRQVGRPESFRLTPLISPYTFRSLSSGGTTRPTDPTINIHREPPYLDTRLAVGLVYGDNLIAVAGAGIIDKRRLYLKQLQDVTGIRKEEGKAYYRTGLHNGLLWRDTLVSVWESIGDRIGCSHMVIQSYKNNQWETVKHSDEHAYDQVARRMGYRQMLNKNWIKKL